MAATVSEDFQFQHFLSMPLGISLATVVISLSLLLFTRNRIGRDTKLRAPPKVPGLPLIGNLVQLKEKKPYKTFTKWARSYGPIYSIRLGASSLIVLNSTDVAKEAMVTRFSSISTRKLSNALKVLTSDKCMVATSDYGEFHKMAKRHILANVLGANAQKQHRCHRETLVENVTHQLYSSVKSSPLQPVNFRKIFVSELFGLTMREALGKDIGPTHVKELATTLSREEVFKVLVTDMMEGAIEVDLRDFFPYLSWIPNKKHERKIQQLSFRRNAVMKALLEVQKQRIASGEEINCYVDYLLSKAPTLTEEQVIMLLWETIIESADTTLVVTEWAMYELAKDPKRQDRLFQEIENGCGSAKVTEENLPRLPYLSAVFHETLRKHSPAPVLPPRYVHEDTQLGGYHIAAGSEIAINIYGCNMDEKQWSEPDVWNPERFLDGKHDSMDLHMTMAFGAGKRVCAGSLQAMLISCVAISRLVQEFVWRLADGEEEDINTVSFTTQKARPLHAILEPRY